MAARLENDGGIDWDGVYATNAGRLRRLIARRVQPPAVDDVLQETFLRAFRGSDQFDRARPIEPWLTTIAVRAAADARRAAGDVAPLDPASVPGSPSVEEEYETQVRHDAIRASLGSLTARHRHLLEQVAVEGRSQAAVARTEGVHPDAVRAAVARARRQFRMSYARLVDGAGLVAFTRWRTSATAALHRLRVRCQQLDALFPPGDALRAFTMAVTVFALRAAAPGGFEAVAHVLASNAERGAAPQLAIPVPHGSSDRGNAPGRAPLDDPTPGGAGAQQGGGGSKGPEGVLDRAPVNVSSRGGVGPEGDQRWVRLNVTHTMVSGYGGESSNGVGWHCNPGGLISPVVCTGFDLLPPTQVSSDGTSVGVTSK